MTDSPPTAPRTSTGTSIAAVVITDTRLEGLGELLEAVTGQSTPPDRILIVDRTEGGLAAGAAEGASGDSHTEVLSRPGMGLRQVVSDVAAALAGPEDEETNWFLWVLPVGIMPAQGALAAMVEVLRRSPSAGMIGPKLLDAADPRHLRSAGFRATRSGRLLDDPGNVALDQQQYDQRSDVLAVPVAGALVDAALVGELGGWQSLFGDTGSDLDFGWRAHRAGRRVLLAPRGRIGAGTGLGLATGVDGSRRRAARAVALTRCAWWAMPFMALWLLATSIVGALVLLLVKRPRAAWHEFADLGALEPVRLVRARLARSGPASVRRRDIAALFVSGSEIRGRIADGVHDALFPNRSRVEEGTVETRASSASRLLRHPGFLAVAAVLVATALAARTLGTATLKGLAGGLTGGELTGGPLTSAALWHAWADGWIGAGLGAPSATGGPHLGLLAGPTWVLEHLPGTGSLAAPGGLLLAGILLAGPGLAAGSAYLAGRVVTPQRWPRAVAAVLWAIAGPALPALAQGRLAAVVALVLLPAIGAGLVLLARRDGTATAAWATALATGLLGAFAPALLLLVVALCLVIVLTAGTAGARLRALVPALVGPASLGPWWLTVRHDPRLLLAGPGATSWGDPDPSWWEQVSLHPGGPGSTAWWLVLPVGAVALLGLAKPTSVRSLPSGAALTALIGLTGVLILPRIRLAAVPEGAERTGTSITPWMGLPMLVLELGVLALALAAVSVPTRGRAPAGAAVIPGEAALPPNPPVGPGDRRWQVLRRVGVGVLGLTALALVAATVRSGLGTTLTAWRDSRPAVAIEHTNGDVAGRTLLLEPGPAGLGYRLVSREIADVARGLPTDRGADAELAADVAGLAGGGTGTASVLANAAIGTIGLPITADATIRRALDSTEGLTRLVAREGVDYWRVAAAGDPQHRPVAPPRLQLLDPVSSVVVPTTGQHSATATTIDAATPTTLIAAEPLGWAERAVVRLDDEVLRPDETAGRPAYAIPAGTHELTISLDDHTSAWRNLQALGAAVLLFLAIPFGSRASRRRP